MSKSVRSFAGISFRTGCLAVAAFVLATANAAGFAQGMPDRQASPGGPRVISSGTVANLPAALQKFAAGQVRLECATSCSMTFGAARRQLKRWHDAQIWTDLAARVVEIGYDNDLAYFYLGKAADGLGYPDAAVTYFRLAQAARKCDGFINNCDGFIFPRDAATALERIGGGGGERQMPEAAFQE